MCAALLPSFGVSSRRAIHHEIPRRLTRRDVVDDQLNATAINMIHMAITPKDRAHIRSLKTAKEAWDKLEKLFLGNASIQSSRFDEVNNMADNFVMIEGETPEEMYRRLIALAVQMQDLGATFVDDHWIKRKFYNALLPYEEVKLTAIRQNASFRAMTSDEVLSEVIALDISKKNAEDLVARAHNSRKPNLALKMKVHEASESDEDPVEWGSDDLKVNYHEHMALAAKKFWDGNMSRNTRPRRSRDSPRRLSKSPREGTKGRTCYNCGDKNHFVADCMFERREDHGGKLIPKDRYKPLSKGFSKFSPRSDDDKVSSNKKPRAFIIREEYTSDEDGEHEDKRSNKEGEGVAAIAISTPSNSLFDSPNENLVTNNARCLMAKDRDHALELVGDLKKKMLSLEEANKGKDDEDPNSCHDELVDQVTSLRRHNALLLEVNALQEEALDEYYRLFKEKTSCCNHEEEIAALEITKAKLLSLSSKQEESLVECLRMSKEKDTCCDHEEGITALTAPPALSAGRIAGTRTGVSSAGAFRGAPWRALSTASTTALKVGDTVVAATISYARNSWCGEDAGPLRDLPHRATQAPSVAPPAPYTSPQACEGGKSRSSRR
ncbi:hypothetical protein QYE76_017536 [Lolium multiflorum]|uniref:CCHC-type domain-containing protein n=1 Tax=Lolium multiflorum TaxID=4521 RepID=A0AAD8UW33_LOLMU|nr:hypothetical protein QYE76_017536 [Lolium multiflorum]